MERVTTITSKNEHGEVVRMEASAVWQHCMMKCIIITRGHFAKIKGYVRRPARPGYRCVGLISKNTKDSKYDKVYIFEPLANKHLTELHVFKFAINGDFVPGFAFW